MKAGLSSWAADFGLVGLKNLYVFSSELLALETKKSTDFFSASIEIWWVVVGSNHWLPPCEGGTLPLS